LHKRIFCSSEADALDGWVFFCHKRIAIGKTKGGSTWIDISNNEERVEFGLGTGASMTISEPTTELNIDDISQ